MSSISLIPAVDVSPRKRIENHFAQALRATKHRVMRTLAGQIFDTPLVVHWCAHKAMSGYYTRVMLELRKRTGLQFSAHYADATDVDRAIENGSRQPSAVVLLSDLFDYKVAGGIPYRGTITLRDPRDLVISGYHYHLRTSEVWANDESYDWDRIFGDEIFVDVFGDPIPSWRGRSYSTVLNSLEQDQGILLEIVRVAPVIRQIRELDFDNPNLLAIRFEEILGNETESFSRIFDHYGLQPKFRRRALDVVASLSASKQAKRDSHIRSARAGEWKNVLKSQHLDMFNRYFESHLHRSGYAA